MDESSWNQYLARKQEQQQQQRRRPAPQPAPPTQPEEFNPYIQPGSGLKPAPDQSESAYWQRRAEEQSNRNHGSRPQGWTVPAFNGHYNQAEQAQEQQALSERVQSVAQSDKGGVWKGLRLPPGSKFKPGKNEMINGSQNTPAE